MNCTAYGTQKFLWISIISSLIPPCDACDLWNHELGTDLMKENCLKSMFEKIHIYLHFNNTNSPILTVLIMTSFTNSDQHWMI